MTSSIPTSAATARAVASLSPVSSTGRRPSALSDATASADVGLTVSATTSTRAGRAVPAGGDRRAARALGGLPWRPPARAGMQAQSASSAGAPERRRRGRRRRPRRRGPRGWRSPRRAGSAPSSSRAPRAIAWAIGCSEASSSAPASRSTLVAILAVGGDDVDERHAAGRHGAGLVEHDRVDRAGGLEDLRALDQQAELRAAAGADEQRGRRGEPERARAGDDQHGDGGGERERRVLAGADPEAERRDGEADHDRDEHARDAVGEPLHGRLAALRVGDEPRDLGQRGVGADLRRADDEAAAGVDRRAGDLVAGRLLDRHGLAGEQRLVDRATGALLDDRRRSRPSRRGGRRSGRRRRAARPARGARCRRRRARATSLAPSSSSAVSAAPARRLARASK